MMYAVSRLTKIKKEDSEEKSKKIRTSKREEQEATSLKSFERSSIFYFIL